MLGLEPTRATFTDPTKPIFGLFGASRVRRGDRSQFSIDDNAYNDSLDLISPLSSRIGRSRSPSLSSKSVKGGLPMHQYTWPSAQPPKPSWSSMISWGNPFKKRPKRVRSMGAKPSFSIDEYEVDDSQIPKARRPQAPDFAWDNRGNWGGSRSTDSPIFDPGEFPGFPVRREEEEEEEEEENTERQSIMQHHEEYEVDPVLLISSMPGVDFSLGHSEASFTEHGGIPPSSFVANR